MINKFISATKVSCVAIPLAWLCLSPAHAQSITNPIAQLKSHILGTTNLTASQIVAQGNSIQTSISQVGTNAVALAAAFDLVSTFDASANKPLFTSGSTTYGGFTRDGAGDELAQALFDLQQGILDYGYTAANLVSNLSLLNGKKFGTSSYFPGAVTPPASTNTGYAVQINASVLADWGSPASYQTTGTRRPTGCYLAPGSIGTVTVPAALVNNGYSIRVGAHYWDLSAKTTVKRLDRVARVYSITSATTLVANPLGGGIYIEVPYTRNLGVVTVGITNVVRSPLFRATSVDQTTAAEWLTERTQPGPWADFESDKFMMQVPRSWIYNYTGANTVMTNWDKAMDAVSDLMGRNRIRSKTVLYIQPDVAYRGTANFPGYPQSNYPYDPNTVESGNKNHFLLTGPQNADWTVLHELGHAELFTKFTGEVEAVVNLNYVAVNNQKFGVPLETAFGRAVDGTQNENVNLAQGALTWIMTDSFRAGETMSQVRMQYQQRGFGKYVEIANLFGWGALSNFWHSVNVDYTNGIDYPENTDPTDSRMLRMSKAAGVDLRPLIHFWGVLPISPNTLKTNIQNAGLPPSALIYNRLKYYQTVVPTNLTQFTAHHTAVANVVDGSVDGAWYADMLTNFTPAIGYSTISNVQKIVDLYFPSGLPTGTLSNTPAAVLTANSAALKAKLGCNGNNYFVHAFWNTVNGTTNAALWTNSASIGSLTNVSSTNLSFTASGLTPGRVYYYTFRATNAFHTLWATNVLSFTIAPAFDWSGATSANMSGTPANWGGTVPTATDVARWNAATYTNAPTANANLTLGQLLFDAGNTGGVTFGGGTATLTLNGVVAGTGLQMNSGSGAVNTGGAQFALGADQIWSNDDNSPLTVGGPITNGGFLLTLDGVGPTILNGVISGAGDLAVANGTNTLGGANSYTGDTIINSGTLRLGASNVIPDGSGYGNVTNNGRLDLNTFSETINGLSGAGTVDTLAGGSPTLTVGGNNQTSTFSGVITDTAGTLSLTKIGTGTLTLTGANGYAGVTTVSNAALNVQHAFALGTTSGGTVVYGSATGSTGNGRVELEGDITITGEPLTINGAGNFYGALSSKSGSNTWAGPITIGAAGTRLGASAGGTLAVDGAINSGLSGYGLTLRSSDATGTVLLKGVNTYFGDTTNLIGRLQLAGGANRLPVATRYVTGNAANVDELDLNGCNQELAGIAVVSTATNTANFINNSAAACTLTVNTASDSPSTFGGIIKGNLALTKIGTNSLTLAGTNTYTGNTTVSNGTLLVSNPSGSGTGTGAVTVSGGTLGGTGIISGAVTNNAGGTLAPGTSVGTLTLSGNLVLKVGSTNTFEVNGSTPTNDVIILGATVTYGGVLNIVLTGNFTAGQTFKLFSGAGATNAGNFASLIGSPGSGQAFSFTNGVLSVVTAGPSGPATLTNSVSGGVLSLAWPAGQNWRLQYQTNALTAGLGTNWVEAANSSVSSTNITIDGTLPTVFYRLVYP